MPTVIIRPDAIGAEAGFDQSGPNLLSRINDNDTGTAINQNQTSANFNVGMGNSSDYSGATINNVVVSVTGNTINAKVPEASFEVRLLNASDTILQSSTLTFTHPEATENTAAYSTSLTHSVVDGFKLTGAVDEPGFILKKVFITVDYTAAASGGGTITLSSGKITLTSGKITL